MEPGGFAALKSGPKARDQTSGPEARAQTSGPKAQGQDRCNRRGTTPAIVRRKRLDSPHLQTGRNRGRLAFALGLESDG